MSAALRVALIGCGRMGAHTSERTRATLPRGWLPVSHAEAIRATPGLELAAVCDARAETARTTAEKLALKAWYTDYRAMIAEQRPDIVSIATRTEGRCEIVEHAARNGVRGLHVEKPLGRSLGECRRAMRAVEAARVPITYGTTRRWMDVYRRAGGLVIEGVVGALRSIAIEHGRGSLMWTHPHAFDLIVWLGAGRRVRHVQASCAMEAVNGQVADCDPVVENAFVEFDDGLTAAITAVDGMGLRLSCAQGVIAVAGDGEALALQRWREPQLAYLQPAEPVRFELRGSGTQQAFRELAEAVRSGGSPGITPAEILLSNQLGLACAWSSLHGGRRVRLDEVPEAFTVTGRQGVLYA